MAETEKCPECEEMQKIHKDYCIWCSYYKNEPVNKTDELNGSEKPNSSVKIHVISMKDVPKIMEEMEK